MPTVIGRVRLNALLLAGLVSVPLFLAACVPLSPVAKVALIAPFEGLHRRSGYGALEAMRSAIETAEPSGAGILPLALDGHAQAEQTARAVAKALVDPAVVAVIGPLQPHLTPAAAPLLMTSDLLWIAPYAVDPDGGFADPRQADAWATGLVAAIGAAARQQGASTLYLAGPTAGWPPFSAAEWSVIADLPVELIDETEAVGEGGAVFWLGASDVGAAFLNRLRRSKPDVPFWLGPQGEDPVFAERAASTDQVFWATWTDLEYTAWAADRSQPSPGAYLVDLATNTVLSRIPGAPLPSRIVAEDGMEPGSESAPAAAREWLIQVYKIQDGLHVALDLR